MDLNRAFPLDLVQCLVLVIDITVRSRSGTIIAVRALLALCQILESTADGALLQRLAEEVVQGRDARNNDGNMRFNA